MRIILRATLIAVYLMPLLASGKDTVPCRKIVSGRSADAVIRHLRNTLSDFMHPNHLKSLEEKFPLAPPPWPTQLRTLAGLNLLVVLKSGSSGSDIRAELRTREISFRLLSGNYKMGTWTVPESTLALSIPLTYATLADVKIYSHILLQHTDSIEQLSVESF